MARQIKVEIIGDARRLRLAFREAERSTSGFGRNIARAGVFAATGLAGIAAGAAVAAGTAVKAAATFDKTMRQVATIAKLPASAMADLRKVALDMGAKTSFSASQASEAMLELAKGGMTAAQIKAGGLQHTLTLAAAGGLELGEAANTVIKSLGQFGLKVDKAGDAAAALAGGANASTASVQDLSEALAQVGPGARNAGLSLQETVAVLAEFSDNGIRGSDAGTSLKTMLTSLVPQTSKAADAMKDLGLKFVDAHGSFLPITEIAQQLHDRLSKLSEAQRVAALQTIFGSDATRAATVLMQKGAGGLAKYIKATNDRGAAEQLAKSNTEGAAGAFERFKGAIETVQIEIGTMLLPKLADVADWFSTKLPAALDLLKTGLSKLTGPGGLAFSFDDAKDAVKQFADGFGGAEGVQKRLDDAKAAIDTLKTSIDLLNVAFEDSKNSGLDKFIGLIGWLVGRAAEEFTGAAKQMANAIQFVATTAALLSIVGEYVHLGVLHAEAWLADLEIGALKTFRGIAQFMDFVFHTHMARSLDGAIASAEGWRRDVTGKITDAKATIQKKWDDLGRALGKPVTTKVNVKGTIHWDKNAQLLKELTGNFSHKLPAQPFAEGGLVTVGTGATADDVLARLSKGEFVVNAKATQAIGPENLKQLNAMRFATGGLAAWPPGMRRVTNSIMTDATRTMLRNASSLHGRDALAMLAAMGGAAGFPGGAASGSVIRLALAQARRMAASFKVALALIEAGIVESGLRNLPYGDRDSLGFLQQRPSQGWLHPMNISYAAWDFLRRAIPIQGRYGTAGMLAQAVQRSAFPARYDAVQARALGILHAYGYDRGGLLPPGLSLAWNGTGRPERVGGGVTVNTGGAPLAQVNIDHFDGSRQHLQMVQRAVDDGVSAAFARLEVAEAGGRRR